jgi:hypothetical protein
VVEDDDEADFVPKPSAASSPLETAAFEQFAAHVISRPDGIRSRAQGSATISAAATAAIAAFGGFSGLDRRPWWVQGAVILALGAWLLSTWLYIRAITASAGPKRQTSSAADMLKEFRNDAADVRRRVRSAADVTWVAIALTAFAVVLLASYQWLEGPETFRLSLAKPAAAAVEDACELPDPAPDGPQITAELHPDDLTKPVVTLRIPRGHCRRGEPVTVRVRGTSIVATHRPPPDDARGTH